jgi:RNA polymerase sigma-70 factor (ECF subfamily)
MGRPVPDQSHDDQSSLRKPRGSPSVRIDDGIEEPASHVDVETMSRPHDLEAGPEGRVGHEHSAGLPSIDPDRRGDRKAMARFVELHSDAVYRFLHHRLDRREVLDDLVQETFLAAWRSLDRFRGESEVRTWLLGIARHKLADHYRSRIRVAEMALEPGETGGVDQPSAGFDVDERLDAGRLEARTRRTLAKLPDSYRAALLWRYWDERPTAEMAALSGQTEKAVERLLDRARKLFKRRWNDD